MKRTILLSIAALAIGAGAALAAEVPDSVHRTVAPKSGRAEHPAQKKAGCKMCAGKMCPEALEGVETVVKNTPEGVEITMTAKNAETIAKVRELAKTRYGDKETMDKDCPARVEGAEAKLENTAAGVKVNLTGKTPAVISRIQEASAKQHMKAGSAEGGKKTAKASKKYACPMKCAESDKPGKCPKCGMTMTEKK